MGLWNDVKLYKTTNIKWHAGDVYEHSMWIGLCLEKWFNEKKFWMEGLDEKYKKLLIFAGFLHDIGKAGDWEFTFKAKDAHPNVGFNYLIGASFYKTKNGAVFDFDSYLDHFEFDKKQKAIIAVLVGIHYDFGKKVMSKISDPYHPDETIFKQYLDTLQDLAQETGYPDIFTRQLVIMSIAIGAADVRAAQPVYYASSIFEISSKILPVHKGGKLYEQYKFETNGKIIREALLAFYDKHY